MENAAAKAYGQKRALAAFLVIERVPSKELENVGIVFVAYIQDVEAARLCAAGLIPTLITVAEFINNIAVFRLGLAIAIPIV